MIVDGAGPTGDGYGVACPPVVRALSTGWGASVVSVAVAVGATSAKVDSVAAGRPGSWPTLSATPPSLPETLPCSWVGGLAGGAPARRGGGSRCRRW